MKEKGFIVWLSKILNISDPKELDNKIKNLGESKLKELANQFETEIWPMMEKELTTSAKQGSKLDFITRLNGDCPEGYEVERFLLGGKPCSRCKKKSTMQMKKGSVMDDIKSEIEFKKCGGKKKKKMQDGGKYNENEHATLIENYQKGKIKQNSKEHRRLQELNRNQPNHDPAWNPKKKSLTKDQAKKVKEGIKKHLIGGKVNFFK